MSSTVRAAVIVAALASTTTQAAGFYFGDNGSKALLQGGAFTGQADDLTAIMYNPAGLARMDGFNFLLDADLINHDTSFTRLDPGFDAANPPTKALANTVTNTGGLFFTPFLGASYGFQLAQRQLTIALGLYGPPSTGRYNYPEPNYAKNAAGKYESTPLKTAPQRYSLIRDNVIIIFPTLSVAYAIHQRFQLGISLQLIYSKFSLRQAIYSGLSEPRRQTDELPIFDSVVDVDLEGNFIQHGLLSFTGIAGVMVQPLDNLSIGASVRPPIYMSASGKLNIELGEAATKLNTVVTGDRADMSFTLPLEARFGLQFKPIRRLGVNADFVYQGWSSLQEMTLTPRNISLKVGAADPTSVAPFHIPKHWHDSFSVRLGASFDVIKYLTLQAGFFYETGAAPDEYTAIDFLHFDRFFLSGGVTAHLGNFEIVAGVSGTPNVGKVISTSSVRAGSTDPSVPGEIIGAGIYGSGGLIGTLGVRGHFGGSAAAPPPAADLGPSPAPEPAAVTEPSPTPEKTPAPLSDAPTNPTP